MHRLTLSFLAVPLLALSLVACSEESDTSTDASPAAEEAYESQSEGMVPATEVSEAAASLKQKGDDPFERYMGAEDAPLVLEEYLSLGCSHCANFFKDVLPPLKKHYIDTGKVKFIMRDFPLDNLSMDAALLTRCAEPAQSYAMTASYFDRQSEWYSLQGGTKAIQKIAKEHGMTQNEIDACLGNQALSEKLLGISLKAQKELEVNSTPALFINGVRYQGSYATDAFHRALDSLLEE